MWPRPVTPGSWPARPSWFWGSRRTPDLEPWQRESGLPVLVLPTPDVPRRPSPGDAICGPCGQEISLDSEVATLTLISKYQSTRDPTVSGLIYSQWARRTQDDTAWELRRDFRHSGDAPGHITTGHLKLDCFLQPVCSLLFCALFSEKADLVVNKIETEIRCYRDHLVNGFNKSAELLNMKIIDTQWLFWK
jgi:hypothetical protein